MDKLLLIYDKIGAKALEVAIESPGIVSQYYKNPVFMPSIPLPLQAQSGKLIVDI